MRFDKWVIKTDPKVIAKKLKIDPSTVSKWKCGKSMPRKKDIHRLLKMAGGEITATDIVMHFT